MWTIKYKDGWINAYCNVDYCFVNHPLSQKVIFKKSLLAAKIYISNLERG